MVSALQPPSQIWRFDGGPTFVLRHLLPLPLVRNENHIIQINNFLDYRFFSIFSIFSLIIHSFCLISSILTKLRNKFQTFFSHKTKEIREIQFTSNAPFQINWRYVWFIRFSSFYCTVVKCYLISIIRVPISQFILFTHKNTHTFITLANQTNR